MRTIARAYPVIGMIVMIISVSATGATAQVTQAAVRSAVRSFAETGEARVIRTATTNAFPFGAEIPVLRCAPLRTCKVLLNGDEEYLGHVAGDTERWFIQETVGPGGVSLIVIKPRECNVTTDVTVTTSKRIYDLLADAPSCDDGDENPDLPYTPLVEFYYPNEFITEAVDAQERARDARRTQVASSDERVVPGAAVSSARPVATAPGMVDPTSLHFAYDWRRDPEYPWVPEQVYDDGLHTFIRLPAAARRHEQPILFEVAPDGSLSMINYHITPMDSGDVFTVDRVIERAVLTTSGGGERARRLLITRKER